MSLVNVFMWHRIQPVTNEDAVGIEDFRRQLALLKDRYDRILSGPDLVAYLAGEYPEAGRFAAVTFDDGWLDNLIYATPVLVESDVPAILALSTGYLHDESPEDRVSRAELAGVGSAEAFRRADKEKDCRCFLSRQAVGEMLDTGVWDIQGHGHTHRKLNWTTDDVRSRRGISVLAGRIMQNDVPESDAEYVERVRKDLVRCRNLIGDLTDERPRLFFWPWGQYTAESLWVAARAGYRYTLSTDKGHAGPDWPNRTPVPRIGASPRWVKFRRNVVLHRVGLLSRLHAVASPMRPGLVQLTQAGEPDGNERENDSSTGEQDTGSSNRAVS